MPTSASSPVRKLFDYDNLDAADAVFVQQQTGAIQSLMKRSAQDIVEIGQRLIEVKKRLKHGRFGVWLEAEFEWSQDTANNFMRVAQRFGNNPKISEFAPSALYLLSAPSTPSRAKEEAISRAAAGESISYKAAKSIKQKYSPPPIGTNAPASQVSQTRLEVDSLQEPVSTQGAPTPPQANTSQVDTSSSARVGDSAEPPSAPPSPPTALPSFQAPSPSAAVPPLTLPLTTPPLKSGSDTLRDQRAPVNNSPTQAPSASSPALLRQRATEPPHSRLEIMAIRPREATALEPVEATEAALERVTSPEQRTPRFVQPGTWWQLAEEHLLFCGDPASARFRERLPELVALTLAFPPGRVEWPQSPSEQIGSYLVWFTRYQNDQDFQTFRKMIEGSLLLATEGGDAVVFSFLPDPEILFLADELQCRWFCAEPDAVKCEAAITLWRGRGFRAEKVSGLRF